VLSGKEKENDFPSDERSEVEGNTLSLKLSALGHKSRQCFNSMENFNTNKLRTLTINTEKYFYLLVLVEASRFSSLVSLLRT
jgi:hypothetical protein